MRFLVSVLALFVLCRADDSGHACGGPGGRSRMDVRLTIIFANGKPTESVRVKVPSGSFLIDVLDAAQEAKNITFEYELQKYGVYITGMDGVLADKAKREYWAIKDGDTGSYLPLGASCYQPHDNQPIYFSLENY